MISLDSLMVMQTQSAAQLCFAYTKKRKYNKGTDQNKRNNLTQRKVHYLPVISSALQLTSSSSSSSSSSPSTSSSTVSSDENQSKVSNMISAISNSGEPSAPPSGLVLFNSEEQSDIVFLVGNESDDFWRFPAHSFVVKDVSPVFRAIVESGTDDPQRHITCCKPEIFHVILRYIYTKDIAISSVSQSLAIFTAADQFLIYEVQRKCLTFLYDNCCPENVLQMISHFSHFSHVRLNPIASQEISSDQNPGVRQRLTNHSNYDNVLNELITKCYRTLDANANAILKSEAFDTIDHELVIKILSRDTLKINSELDVFDCLMRWASHQCICQRKELTSENKREVLEKAIYCPRYLVMTSDEFVRGPYISDVLTDAEKMALLDRLMGTFQTVMPAHLSGRKLDVSRQYIELTNDGDDENQDHDSRLDQNDTDIVAGGCSGQESGATVGSGKKKVSASKKLLNGLGDIMVCVIQLLD